MTVEAFLKRLVAALKTDPPALPENKLDHPEFGSWLLRHFSLEELEVIAIAEDELGEDQMDNNILDAFVEAGLPRPVLAQ